MSRMPTAQWRPLPRPSTTRMSRYDLVVIHTMVGSLEGTDGYFRGLTNGVNSHFGTGGDGTKRQWVDTAVRSGANGAGNHRAITVENADMGPEFAPWNTGDGAAVPPFTPEQVESNAEICAWAHLEHGVPLVAVDTSRPNARGVGFHRLGCDPWRVPDGELWSSSRGKVCPAPRRIAQIPQIITRARQLVAPRPVPIEKEDEMRPAYLQAPNRPWVLAWPGYMKVIANDEEQLAAMGAYGDFLMLGTREWDVRVALLMNGAPLHAVADPLRQIVAGLPRATALTAAPAEGEALPAKLLDALVAAAEVYNPTPDEVRSLAGLTP